MDIIRDRHLVGTVDKIAGTGLKNSENIAIFKQFIEIFRKSDWIFFDSGAIFKFSVRFRLVVSIFEICLLKKVKILAELSPKKRFLGKKPVK